MPRLIERGIDPPDLVAVPCVPLQRRVRRTAISNGMRRHLGDVRLDGENLGLERGCLVQVFDDVMRAISSQ